MAIPAMPPIPGVDDVFTLLAFLADPTAYQARLDALQAYAKRLDARLAEIGLAEATDQTLLQARADRQMAGEELRQAKAQASALIGTALEDRDAAVAAAAQARRALDAERVEFETALVRAQADLATAGLAVAKRESDAREMLAEGQARLTEAKAIKADYEARLARLEAGIAAARG